VSLGRDAGAVTRWRYGPSPLESTQIRGDSHGVPIAARDHRRRRCPAVLTAAVSVVGTLIVPLVASWLTLGRRSS